MVTIKIKNKMYFLFTILCLLLLLFHLDPIPGRPHHNHYALVYSWNEFRVVRIFPQNWYVLIDKNGVFSYEPTESLETYIPAIRLDNHRKYDIFHYRYLLDWMKEAPVVISYPLEKKNLVDILNYITSTA